MKVLILLLVFLPVLISPFAKQKIKENGITISIETSIFKHR
jgi:hypothetical protein